MSAPAPLGPSTSGVPATIGEFSRSPNLALAIWFNDDLFNRAKTIASYIAKADGFAPAHLIGKPEACFAVVTRALTWRLDPFAVAQSTYQPAQGAKVGFEGKLVQAILENSGRLEGGIEFEHFGDWAKVQGRFEKRKNDKGREYAVPAWKPEDETGLGVIVRAKLRGEGKPREFRFLLVQAFPRNSTLWALDPMTQICYLAVRRFASVCAPALLMGVPFDREDEPEMINITPAADSARAAGVQADDIDAKPDSAEPYRLVTDLGEMLAFDGPDGFATALCEALAEAADRAQVEGLWESNSADFGRLPEDLKAECRETYDDATHRLIAAATAAAQQRAREQGEAADRPVPIALKVPTGDTTGIKDYRSFLTTLGHRLQDSDTIEEFDEWQRLNLAEMDEARRAFPKAYASLEAVITKRSGELLSAEGGAS